MSLSNKILEIKLAFFNALSFSIEKVATIFFNYPNNQGMPVIGDSDSANEELTNYLSKLPKHFSNFPPMESPHTLLECFFGTYPIFMPITRTFYEHKLDGFYNFYVKNYQNIVFLPDWVSQFIQINFEITVDDTILRAIQEGIFISCVAYAFIIELRLKLYWFLTINPYTRPWVYILSMTDWLCDMLSGSVPVILGLDLSTTLVLTIFGKFVDSVNHLVFTMPFLPSEGVPGQMFINGRLTDVILFRYLPSLWYTHPIPDKLREFWYSQRPDILDFMEKNYGHLNIDFLPNRILKTLYEQKQIDLSSISTLSTNLNLTISDNSFIDTNFSSDNWNSFFNFIIISLNNSNT